MDNSLKTKEKPLEEGVASHPAKGKTKTFLIGKDSKQKTYCKFTGVVVVFARRGCSEPNPNGPDSLRQGASQAAGAAPTLRYGPAGDSAPRLRLRWLVWPKGSFRRVRPFSI